MTASAQTLIDELEARGIQLDYQQLGDGGDLIGISFAGSEEGVSYEILTIIDRDESNIILRCFNIYPVEPEQEVEALRAINQLNMDFRWMKFYLDEENQVAAGTDAIVTLDNAAVVAFDLLGRALHIINAGYKFLGEALCGREEE